MLRKLTVLALAIFLTSSAGYMVVYIGRALRLDGPSETVVRLWHGDDFARGILLAVFVVLAVLLLGILWLSHLVRGPAESVRIRRDLYAWVAQRAQFADESPEAVVERAVGMYRSRLDAGPSSTVNPEQ